MPVVVPPPAIPSSGDGQVKVVADWISVPRDGEIVNGDCVLVRREPGCVLLAVVDALGHGPHAHEASAKALAHLQAEPLDGGIAGLMGTLHTALRGTRGAAALLMLVTNQTVECSSVGNVDLRIQRTKLPFRLTAGIVGHRLRPPHVAKAALTRPERIMIFSDGISRRFDFSDVAGLPPREASSKIFASCRRAHDDATILVADLP